jgi:hypothetical protein
MSVWVWILIVVLAVPVLFGLVYFISQVAYKVREEEYRQKVDQLLGQRNTSYTGSDLEVPVCPRCGVEYHRVAAVWNIQKKSGIDFATWAANYPCPGCGGPLKLR